MTKSLNYLAAIKYLKEFNFSVIPVGHDKKPLLKWLEFQKRHATEDEVRSWFEKWPKANIGIITGMISNLCVFDTDDYEADKVFTLLLPEQVMCPIVATPRGGRHYYFQCPDDRITNKAMMKKEHMDFRGNGGYVVAAPSQNGNGKSYKFLPSAHLKDIPIPLIPQVLIDAFGLSGIGRNSINAVGIDVALSSSSFVLKGDATADSLISFEEGNRDESLFRVANHLTKGGMIDTSILKVLESIAKSWGEEDQTKWFNDKIKSAMQRKEHRDFSLTDDIGAIITATDGDFTATDVYNILQSATHATNCYKINKKSVGDIMRRFRDRGIIQKAGSRDGHYRRVDDIAEEIDFLYADITPLDVQYPLGIESLVNTMSKNIIIVAGASDAGKTAFLLRFVQMNMKNHKINYYSSEMGANELKSRLSKFDDCSLHDFAKYAKWKERVGNFSDVMNPDQINIIDFLEMHDDFYKVGAFIKEIFDKLNKGIAIIAIQKNAGNDYALGGQRSIEKARLYLSMDSGRMKIVKGKNWKDPDKNPHSRIAEFKIVQGCKFIPTSLWIPEAELEEDAKHRKGEEWK